MKTNVHLFFLSSDKALPRIKDLKSQILSFMRYKKKTSKAFQFVDFLHNIKTMKKFGVFFCDKNKFNRYLSLNFLHLNQTSYIQN